MARHKLALQPIRNVSAAHFRMGGAYLKAEQYAQAIRELKEALEQDPNMVPARLCLGDVYKAQGATEKALEEYESALKVSPRLPTCHLKLGDLHFSQKRYDIAIECYRTALRFDTKIANAHFRIGSALLEQEKFDDAIESLRVALELSPQQPKACVKLGDAYRAKGQQSTAISLYQKAINLNPKSSIAYVKMGDVHLECQWYAEAMASYLKAAATAKPRESRAYVSLGNADVPESGKRPSNSSRQRDLKNQKIENRMLPQLRPDLEVLQEKGEEEKRETFLLRDPRTGWIFQLAEASCLICRLLDGKTSLKTLQACYEARFGEPLVLRHFDAFLSQLGACGLLNETGEVSNKKLEEIFARPKPLRYRIISLPHPDPLFSWLASRLRWCFTRQFVLTTILGVLFAVWIVVNYWPEFASQLEEILEVGNLGLLALIGVLLVWVPRYLVKGIACKHFGGVVSAAGFRFNRIRPRPFVDISHMTWRPKSSRMRIAFAEGYTPIFTWAVGIIGWWLTTPGTQVNISWLFLGVIAGMRALWIWNPALKRTGYQILSAWLDIPRLRERAMRVLKKLLFSLKWGEPLTSREKFLFVIYGITSWTYILFHIWLVWTHIGAGLVKKVGGPGAIIVLIVIGARWLPTNWLRAPERPVRWLLASEARASVKLIVRLSLLTGIIILLFLPYRLHTGGPFKIVPTRRVEIHAEVQGKITKIMVSEGQEVAKDQALAVIGQREYEKNLKIAEQQLVEADAQLRLLLAGPKPEDVEKAKKEVDEAQVKVAFGIMKARRYEELYQKEMIAKQEYEDVLRQRDLHIQQLDVAKANLELIKSGARKEEIEAKQAEVHRLQTLVESLEAELELTVLRAPAPGIVVTPYIDQTVGQYLNKGDLFAVIHASETVQLEISVWEGDVPDVQVGAVVTAAPWSYPGQSFEGKVLAIAASATPNEHSVAFVRVLAEIPNSNGLLRPETTGYAKIETETKLVWEMLVRRILRWFRVEVWYWLP